MISYRKAEIEDLANAIGRHCGGLALDWQLVVEPTQRNATSMVELHVEIARDGYTWITTVPLGKAHDYNDHRTATHAKAPRDPSRGGTAAATAAVRRASVLALLAQPTGGDIEALLGYLRCCGILVLD